MQEQPHPPYSAAIVGPGFIGAGDQISGDALGQQVKNLDGTHSAALAGHPSIRLVAGSSRDPGRRDRFQQRTGLRAYADWREMLDREKLDIVSIATYAPVHAEIVRECARRGVKAVYCEKPIATRIADADEMVSACAQSGSLLAINHNRRFNPNYRRLRDLVAAGDLGDLTSVSLRWSSGRLGNIGTHLIDATVMLTGRSVQAVSATLDLSAKPDCRGPQFHDPGGWGVMRFEGGLMAVVDAANHAIGKQQIILYGTKGRAITGRDEVDLEFWDGRRDHWPSTRQQATSMDRAVADIVAWLDGDAPFPYPADQAARTLEVILAFHASHARGAAWVDLPLTAEDRARELKTG